MVRLLTRTPFHVLYFCLVYSLLFSSAYAQTSYNFRQISTQNGLSSNEINAIVEDKTGLMWFATPDGLNKYDGTNVTIYLHKDGDASSLPGNEVYALYRDKKNVLWIGTSNGLCYYDDQKDAFVSNKAFVNLPIRSICADHTGNLWVGSYSDLRIIDGRTGKITIVPAPAEARQREKVWCILALFEDNKNHMWIGSQVGAFRYDYSSKHIQSFVHNDANPSSLSNNYVTSITQDRSGRLWLGTLAGLNMLKANGQDFQVIKLASEKDKDQHNNIIHAIANGAGNQLWIGTEGGINIFDPKTFGINKIQSNYRNLFSLKSDLVRTVYRSHDGIYWIGLEHGGVNNLNSKLALFEYQPGNALETRSMTRPIVTSFAQLDPDRFFVGTLGGGLQIFDKRNRRYNTFHFSQEVDKPLSILSLKKSSHNVLWVGTYENGLFKVDPKSGKYEHFITQNDAHGISENVIYCIEEDHTGNIWVGTNGKGVMIFDPVSNKMIACYGKVEGKGNGQVLPLNGFIRAIAEKSDNNVWIGSYGSGIAVYHPKDKTFTALTKANSDLINNHVLSILHDKKGNTWVGTNGGLCRFNYSAGKFVSFNDKESLLKQMIFKMLEDNTGVLWLSTNRGIVQFNPATRKAKEYTHENGVLNSPFFVGSGLVAADGQLFFGGEFGFNYFYPQALPVNKNASPVIFTELKVANNTIGPGKGSPINVQINTARAITLKHGQNFSLSYVAVNYANPSQTQYAYKLEGFDKDWNLVGSAKTAQYTNLDPGEYVFKVKASNGDGFWTPYYKTVVVKVLPPWWRTGWAYFFYFLIISAALYLYRRNTIRKLELKFEVEKEKIRAKELIELERRETQRLRELDLMKIKFLTNISHEFRTPISLIITPVEQMLSLAKDSNMLNQAKLIQRNARRLLNLVNQLLDFRRLEEHELKLNLNPGDLANFIKEAAESFQDLAERKKIKFDFHSECSNIPAFFDHDKVERILFNLLSNAFKFTEEGGEISVCISLLENLDEAKSYLFVQVCDTGIGIPEELQRKVFDRFFQSPNELNTTGSGIGLSITKEFINLHGGQINVESIPGTGSTFSFTLPVIPNQVVEIMGGVSDAKEEATAAANSKTHQGLGEPLPLILIVEDDDDLRFYLKDNLKRYYRILEATNGKEGWQKALSYHPQLIVSDITMPYVDGIELTKKIVADKRTQHIPIILLTALRGEAEQIKGLQAGASDYLTKPFNFELLNAKIKNAFNLNQSVKDTYSKQIHIIGSPVEVVSDKVKFLADVVKYIEENIDNPELNVQELSDKIGVSRGTLYRKILDYTGLKPVEYIRQTRLEKAAQLLEKSDFNVSQIAYMTGFATPAYFARMFKAKYNMAPSEYIQLRRQEIS